MIAPSSRHFSAAARPAVMLLEVVLALTILVAALAAIGIQINAGLRVGHENQRRTQALMLAEAKLAQLDTGALVVENDFDSFGATFPGFFWRFEFEPYDDVTPGMFLVRLDILYDDSDIIIEPGEATTGDIEAADVVTTLHTLRPTPPTLDLQRDFGLTEEQVDEIAAKLPPEIADPANISPAVFAEMDIDTLMEFAPQLMALFGQGFGFSQQQLDAMIERGLDPSALPEDLQDSLDDIRGGGPPARGGGDGARGGGGGGGSRGGRGSN